jgi:hypothetical protein
MRRPVQVETESEPKGSAMRDAFTDDAVGIEDEAVLRTVPDLRGLAVEDASGICVGELWGALAETETGLIRYLDLDLAEQERHVLVPIGHARVQRAGTPGVVPRADDAVARVRLRAALLEELQEIPASPPEAGHITDPFERALLEAYGRTFHGERYYAHPAYDHSGIYVGDHPVVPDDGGADAAPLTRLSYLPGWRVATGEPDIRKWPLVLLGDDGRVPIRDLIIDPAARKVRYVVVETTDGAGARLLPIGYLRVDTGAREVRAAGLTTADIDGLPPYDGGGVTRDREERLAAALRRALTGGRRYLLPDFRGDA